MKEDPAANEVLQRLVRWAAPQEPLRALLLTSTRAHPTAPVDALSDYDVIVVATDIRPFHADRRWLHDFGTVLVAYWDPIYPLASYGFDVFGNVIQYEDGLKLDFTLWPVELLRALAAGAPLPDDLDDGYMVLLDKDGLTGGLRPPTYTVYRPQPPDEAAYLRRIEEFFSDVPYVAKCLWRDELLPAKWCLDYDMKHVYLRPFLEWRAALDHGWALAPGNLGKGLKRRLPPDLWTALERSYVGANIDDNWDSLFQTIAVFRAAAVAVGAALGYAYPHDLDRRVTAYAEHIRKLPRQAVVLVVALQLLQALQPLQPL